MFEDGEGHLQSGNSKSEKKLSVAEVIHLQGGIEVI